MPSHVVRDDMYRTIRTGSDGRIAIYFCPTASCWEPVRSGTYDGTLDISFSADSYITYADNGDTAPTTVEGSSSYGFPYYNYSSTKRFNNAASWRYKKPGLEKADSYRKIRIVSSQLTIQYVGERDLASGVISVGMGFKAFSSSLSYLGINKESL